MQYLYTQVHYCKIGIIIILSISYALCIYVCLKLRKRLKLCYSYEQRRHDVRFSRLLTV